jgi:hypothetical protein
MCILFVAGYNDTKDYIPGKALSFYDYMRSVSRSISVSMRSPSVTGYSKVPLLSDTDADTEVTLDWNKLAVDEEEEDSVLGKSRPLYNNEMDSVVSNQSSLLEEGLYPTRKL